MVTPLLSVIQLRCVRLVFGSIIGRYLQPAGIFFASSTEDPREGARSASLEVPVSQSAGRPKTTWIGCFGGLWRTHLSG